jgi:hypothetical protein
VIGHSGAAPPWPLSPYQGRETTLVEEEPMESVTHCDTVARIIVNPTVGGVGGSNRFDQVRRYQELEVLADERLIECAA